MWNKKVRKASNCSNIIRICYQCSDEDLGKKKVTEKDRHRKAYAKIFEQKALNNMKERLKTFHQFQSQLKQKNHEAEKVSH